MTVDCYKRNGFLIASVILAVSGLLLFTACGPEGSGKTSENAKPSGSSVDSKEMGARIVDDFHKADGAPYSKGRIRMTVVTQGEPTTIYEADVMRKQTPDERITLSHVVKPEASSDMASLSVEKKNEKTQNVSYAQSTGKFVEYDSNKQMFGGMTAQELLGGELEKYDFTYKGEKTIDGVKTFEVESKLKPDQDSVIARSVTFFRQDSKLPTEVHMFNTKGDEIRTVRVTEFRTVEGHQTPWKTDVDNPGRKAKITIEVLSLTFPDKMDDKLFARDNLKRLVAR
jgi:hypothetical protein